MFAGDDPRVGTELAGYRVEALLGRGGMGVVFLAEDLRLRRKVALKLLAPALAEDEGFRERFLHESELAASLDHPNIVPIYEAGEADGSLFIAMRYVDGSDLKELLRAGPLTPQTATNLLAQVAAALDAAHARGLVHRDVKPSNVLIAPGAGHEGADHAYLADFGLTQRLADGSGLADAGQLMGTIDYIAPEQVVGDEIDGRADVYSLGCLLFECLTGGRPFVRESDLAVLFAHVQEEPPIVTEQRPELPEAIDAVVATALEKEPGDRQQTCRALVADARAALGIAEPVRSRLLRVPVLAALIALALVAAGLASYFAISGGGGAPEARHDTLVRIDPATNEVVDSLPVGPRATSLAVGDDGYPWVTSYADKTVWRIDPQTRQARITPLAGTPLDVAVRGGLAVVTNGPWGVSFELIDAASGAATGSFPLAGADYAQAVVSAGDAGIWLAASGFDGENVGIVAGSPAVSGPPGDLERVRIPVDPDYVFFHTPDSGAYNDVAVGAGGVWLTRDGGPLLKRIDPRTKHVVATIELPFRPKSLAVGAGAVWITGLYDDVVARLDPSTNAVTMTIPLGAGTDGVAVGEGSVWIVSTIAGTVTRIDPETGEIQATIDVGERPEDVAVGAEGVWVTSHTA